MFKLKSSVLAFIGFGIIGLIAVVIPHPGFGQASDENGAMQLNCDSPPCDAVARGRVTAQDEAPERSLEGVWLVKNTPRNCTTGDPIPAAAFESLFTFHRDGTMLVSFRNNTFVFERTAAHGLWRRDRGWSDYSFKFVHLRRNLTTGLFAGKQEGGAGPWY